MQYKKLLFVALAIVATGALLLPLTASAAGWSSPFAVGAGGTTTKPSTKPAVAIAPDGSVNYIWYDGTTIKSIKCTGLSSNSCGNAQNLPNKGPSYYPSIAVDSQSRAHAVWEAKDGTSAAYSIYYSRRTGNSWGAAQRISTEPYSELPDVAVGGDDSVHIVYQSKSGQDGSVYYSKSGNSGESFSAPELLEAIHTEKELPTIAERGIFGKNSEAAGPEGNKLSDGFYPRVDADVQGRAHVVWQKPEPYGVGYRYQTGTNSWSATKSFGKDETKAQTPDVAVNGNDQVAIVWTMYLSGDISFAEFSSGSTDFTQDNADSGLTDSFWPKVDADCNGNFHFAYQGRSGGEGPWDIFYNTYNPESNDLGQRQTIAHISASEQTPAISVTNVGAIVYANTTNAIIDASTNNMGLNCSVETPTPTDTATITPTLDPNITPTITLTPTVTPTATETPPVTGTKSRVNDSNKQIQYSGKWSVARNSPSCLYQNDFHYAEPGKKNRAQLTFTGYRLKIWFVKSPTMGNVQVFIDGNAVKTLNLYNSSPKCKGWTSPVVTYGEHSVEIRPKGNAGRVSLDVITVYQ